MSIHVKTANDLISDSIDAYFSGNEDLAGQYLEEAIGQKIQDRFNDVLAQATARVQPPTDKGRRLKIFYMTQASTKPPTFVCFVNSAELFHFSYQRYLENRIRDTFGLEGTPIRFVIRERGEK